MLQLYLVLSAITMDGKSIACTPSEHRLGWRKKSPLTTNDYYACSPFNVTRFEKG